MSSSNREAEAQVLQRLLSAPPVPTAPGITAEDEIYLRVWTIEQEHGKTIWTVVTFFLSISFAIFGLSFQAQITSPLSSISRISALVIYWFGVLLFLRFHTYNRLLRQYLRDLERQGRTSIVVHTRYDAAARGPAWLRMNAGRLLVSFGLLYTLGVIFLLWSLP